METGSVKPRRALLPWALFAAALALAVWALWPRGYGDVLGTTLTSFEKQNRLTVFSAQLSPVVSADEEQLLGLLKTKQVAVIPARVDYTLDLTLVTRDRLTWDKASKRLDVRLPPLTLSRPNLDEGRAQYLREGVWISRDVQAKLTRANTLAAEQQAGEEAASAVLMNLARAAAKDAVRQNLAIPLEVVGYGKVAVLTHFDDESIPVK
jgi:Protein of unknown function (DUF4230)